MTTDKQNLLSVEGLRVELAGGPGIILEDVSVSIEPGQVLGVVGESGSGKTTLALALFGYSRRGVRISGGHVWVQGTDILRESGAALARIRGRVVSYVPQDPAAALNPGRRIGDQVGEAVAALDGTAKGKRVLTRSQELLQSVQLPATADFMRRYPHQLSGGQLQRVAIAMSLAGDPVLLVMDEPTTALDVTTQARILSLVKGLAARQRLGIMYVTHDLAVVAHLADQIAVMYAGAVVETGAASAIIERPLHPYTRGLIAAAPEVDPDSKVHGMAGRAPDPRNRSVGCLFAPRCPWVTPACTADRPTLAAYSSGDASAACIRVEDIRAESAPAARASRLAEDGANPDVPSEAALGGADPAVAEKGVLVAEKLAASYRGHQVLHDISLTMKTGHCLAVVGESGSGKTTLARTIAGLHKEAQGQLYLADRPLSYDARTRSPDARLAVQYVFQNPYASLNPRRTIEKTLVQPLRLIRGLSPSAVKSKVRAAMEQVHLPPELLASYPDELSGGQRQRVAIARALVADPMVLICDEVTSALDVSVQASVVETLLSLKISKGLTMLFITHNIALASGIADEILVLRGGRLVEQGTTTQVVNSPRSDYAQALLNDTPSLHTAVRPD